MARPEDASGPLDDDSSARVGQRQRFRLRDDRVARWAREALPGLDRHLSLLASPRADDLSGPKKDLVAGTATILGFNNPQVHVNAERYGTPEAIRGHWYIRYPTTAPGGGFDMRGEVVCVDAFLNNATVIGQIERVKGIDPFFGGAGFVAGNFVQIRIQDNGEPGFLDRVNFSPGSGSQQSCAPSPGDLVISQGNYIVHEEPPLALLSSLDLLIAQIEAEAH
jgi:hypothetical protein